MRPVRAARSRVRAPHTPWPIRRRLVVGIASLVASVLLLMGILSIVSLSKATTTVADNQLAASTSALSRSVDKYGVTGGSAGSASRTGPDKQLVDFVGHGRGTLIAAMVDGRVTDSALFSDTGAVLLTDDVTDAIEAAVAVAAQDGGNRTLDLGHLGSYRIATIVNPTEVLVAGAPLAAADAALVRQGWAIGILTVVALLVTVAGTIVVVRVALRPLARVVDTAVAVAGQPLAEADHRISVRVAAADTTPSTEVGKVGAALNQLLDHVDHALEVRAATDQRMRRVVTDASHELRTPLAAIQGYAELTRQDSAELPEVTEYSLARIESEAGRMSSLVADLLLLARLDEGQDLSFESVDLADLLLNAVNDARASTPTHTWLADVPDGGVLVHADRERVHQLLANLLSNARMHTPDTSTITARLRVGAPGMPVELTVRDDGPGIPADVLPVIFERFARGDASRAQGGAGPRSTGLGLAIVLSIVEAHGGTIRATSTPGGTTFTVALPAAPA